MLHCGGSDQVGLTCYISTRCVCACTCMHCVTDWCVFSLGQTPALTMFTSNIASNMHFSLFLELAPLLPGNSHDTETVMEDL